MFFDSSSLVKFFHEEEGTPKVSELILSKENQIWISELARIEFLSAVYRRFRNKEIDEEKLNSAIAGFEDQIDVFNIEPLGNAVAKEAELLIRQYGKTHGLRTLDAIQLGTFSLISENGWSFVASDENLCNVAILIGYKAINPLV